MDQGINMCKGEKKIIFLRDEKYVVKREVLYETDVREPAHYGGLSTGESHRSKRSGKA